MCVVRLRADQKDRQGLLPSPGFQPAQRFLDVLAMAHHPDASHHGD